jgi:dUTP pyrophosphatase
MKIKIVNKSNNESPNYATDKSAGMDIRAYIPDKNFIDIEPMTRHMIKTGLYMEIPEGYEAQIRPRSGLSIKSGITIINTPGTIDSDFRDEICVLIINLGDKIFRINNGDRIAQMIINKFEKCEWEHVDIISETDRKGGFGHTGIK